MGPGPDRIWTTDHLTIREVDRDYPMHGFEDDARADGHYLGHIGPAHLTLATLDAIDSDDRILPCFPAMIDALNAGICPICDQWDDGAGTRGSVDGWR